MDAAIFAPGTLKVSVVRLTLFRKLFLALLVCMLFISSAILLSVHWSFKHGFNQYLLQAEANQLDKVVALLQAEYKQHGNWQFIQDDHHLWMDILRRGLEAQHLPPFEDFARQPNEPPPFEHGPPPPFARPLGQDFGFPHRGGPEPHKHDGHSIVERFLGRRVQLLSVDKQLIAGIPEKHSMEYLRPVQLEHQTIAWLAIQSSDLITDNFAQLFIAQQIRHTYLIAVLALFFATFSSAFLARKLLSPIKRIAAGAHTLVSGNYKNQIKVTSQDELGQLAKDFNLLARTLDSNEQARRRWIADISHELRTPLAVLRGEIEAVQDGIRDFSPENLKSLHVEVMSLNRLVDDLYELSLSDLGQSHLQKMTTNIIEVLEEVITNQQPRFQQQELLLKPDFDLEQQIYVYADARRLHQLFSNICENSRRYTNRGGFCAITIQVSPGQICIVFQDTAPGVAESELSKLFDRLYRVENSRNRELGGAGLGLAICQAIVNAHNGTLVAFHSIHGGLGMSLTLPTLAKS